MSIATTTFTGAHWRIDVAGADGGYVADEQDARARVAAVSAALETEIAMRVSEAFFAERNKFLDVVAQLQIANRELEAELAAAIATAERVGAERDEAKRHLADYKALQEHTARTLDSVAATLEEVAAERDALKGGA